MFKDEIWVEVRVVDRCLELIKDVVNEFEDGWVVERVVKEMLEMCKGWLVDGDERKKKIAELCMGQNFIAEAPVVIVACGLPTPSRIGGYASSMLVDVAIAIEHLVLAAENEGLGTCWIGAFDNQRLKRLLRIPEQVQVVAVIPMGYPLRGRGWRTSRKRMEEIVSFEKYEE